MLDLNKLVTFRPVSEATVDTKVNQLLAEPFDRLPDPDLVRFIDYAFLDQNESARKVESRLVLVRKMYDIDHDFRFASVCVFPNHVAQAYKYLKNTDTAVAAVTGNFPTGQTLLRNKLQETRQAIDEGAGEIDYIYSLGNMLDGNYQKVVEEMNSVREVCQGVVLKVILETGALDNLRDVRIASEIALRCGADFIKTSTGKISTGATLSAAYVMLQAMKGFHEETGKRAGIKFSGGIKSREEISKFMNLTRGMMGREWLNANLLRIGAGGLAFTLLNDGFSRLKSDRP